MIQRIVGGLALAGLLVSSALAADVATWNVPGDFATIQDAVDSPQVHDGDRILVGAGPHSGALLTKRLVIEGETGAVIDDGPLHPSGLKYGFRLNPGSSGSEIRSLVFDGVDLAVFHSRSGASVPRVDDVQVVGNELRGAVQGVTNWGGWDWTIAHNRVVDLRTTCGGGIGVLVGDYAGQTVTGNVVEHNAIEGVLHVDPQDCGDYDGTGIVLYADFRWGRSGSAGITDNRVEHNDVALTVDDPRAPGVGGPVSVVGIELTEARDATDLVDHAPVIFGDVVEFNDVRGSDQGIVLTPEDLDAVNVLSRNLGDDENRGTGLPPATAHGVR